MKVDFHTHTSYSYDGLMSPKRLLKAAEKKGLDAIGITDHESMEVFKELEKNNYYNTSIKVIKGCEFKTSFGDIIGLFIDSPIKYKDPYELVEKIHKNGGVVIIPHPFKNKKMPNAFIKAHIKIVETLNGRTRKEKNKLSQVFADKNDKIGIFGSDAHSVLELGKIYTEFNCQSLKKLKNQLLKKGFKTYGSETNNLIIKILKLLGLFKKKLSKL